ncbi:hypothetical protein [Planomonospora sp. ID82291]|nr:hypothetical protein [Planomonospora sp. ID82291]
MSIRAGDIGDTAAPDTRPVGGVRVRAITCGAEAVRPTEEDA